MPVSSGGSTGRQLDSMAQDLDLAQLHAVKLRLSEAPPNPLHRRAHEGLPLLYRGQDLAQDLDLTETLRLPPIPIHCAGVREGLPLPYRGQEIPTRPTTSELQAVPEGPCRCGWV